MIEYAGIGDEKFGVEITSVALKRNDLMSKIQMNIQN